MAFSFAPRARDATSHEPALALVELDAVARGYVTADAVVKKAPVRLCRAHPISPGHFIVLFTGDVASVEESLAEGTAIAGGHLLSHLILSQVHPKVPAAVDGTCDGWPAPDSGSSIAIVETFAVAPALLAADAACKTAPVALVAMKLGQGLGGRAYFALAGELYDIEAAVERGAEVAGGNGAGASMVRSVEIIARPHPEWLDFFRGDQG